MSSKKGSKLPGDLTRAGFPPSGLGLKHLTPIFGARLLASSFPSTPALNSMAPSPLQLIRSRLTRVALALTILFGVAGCRSWRVATVPMAQVLVDEAPDQIRLAVTTDSTKIVLHQPMIVGDSLRGLPTALAINPRMVALSDITEIAVRRFDLGKTVLRTFIIGGAIVLYELLQNLNQTSF